MDACVRMLLNLVLKKSDVHGGAICREGGILVLMDAIKAHPEDTNLQARCQSLLKKIDSSGVQQRQGEWIMAELTAERERLAELMREVVLEQQRFFEHHGGGAEHVVRSYRRLNEANSRLSTSPPRGSRSPGRSRSPAPMESSYYEGNSGFALEQLQAFNSRVALRSRQATRGSYLR